jgi:hypothetical protein
MKKSELKQLIREEIQNTLNEGPNVDVIKKNLNLIDKAMDMVIKYPTGNIDGLGKKIKEYIDNIRKSL